MNIYKMFSKYLFVCLCTMGSNTAQAQTIPSYRLTDWSRAGLQDSVPAYSNVVSIMSYGGVADGVTANDVAFQNAKAALNNQPGIISFPGGSYLFNSSINLSDSIVLQGAGAASKLLFDLGGNAQDMINIQGTLGATIWDVTQYISKNDTFIYLDSTTGLSTGDWIFLYGNDSSIVFSNWAYGSVGQIFRIRNIQGNKITTDMPARRDYSLAFSARIKRLDPVKGVGIECLYIERKDSTTQQTTNINFTNAVNCWVIGVESYRTNFAHIGLTRSAHITVRGNYIHHSWHYGGSGQGYGVATQYTSGDCLIENNDFVHLRHSMLLQAGANGNVLAYNYSRDTYWDESPLPANSAGDAVCHGNYPYLNLFEGNILQNIVVDDSHGINGPFNTFFRNRAQLWGIVMNNTTPTDSMNYTGNEVTNTSLPYGNYTLAGSGHFLYGNNIKGTIMPAATAALPETSLYLAGAPGYWTAALSYPPIGTPYPYNTVDNPAKARYVNNHFTDCALNPHFTPAAGLTAAGSWSGIDVYPNPADEKLFVLLPTWLGPARFHIYNVLGQTLLSGELEGQKPGIIVSQLNPGCYMLVIRGGDGAIYTKQLIKK